MGKIQVLFLFFCFLYQVTPNFAERSRFLINNNFSLVAPFSKKSTEEWQFQGSSYMESDKITLTKLENAKTGSIWNTRPSFSSSWKIELSYTAHRGDDNLIADGIGLWYVPEIPSKGHHETNGGPNSNFTGLMVMVDVYKPLNTLALARSNGQSALIVVYNEVPRFYNSDTEGYEIMSGRCLVKNQVRNNPELMEKLSVEYVDETLKVWHTNGDDSPCVTVKNLKLPLGYHFGVSAATGGTRGVFQVRSFKFYEYVLTSCTGSEIVERSTQQISTLFTETFTNYAKIIQSDPNISEAVERSAQLISTLFTKMDKILIINYALIGLILLILVILIILIIILTKRRINHSIESQNTTTDLDREPTAPALEMKDLKRPIHHQVQGGQRHPPQLPRDSYDYYDHLSFETSQQ